MLCTHLRARKQWLARIRRAYVCARNVLIVSACDARNFINTLPPGPEGGRHVDTSARACEHGKIGRSGERRRNFNSDIIHVKCGPAGCCRPTTSSMCGRPPLHRRRVCRVCTPSSSPCQTRVHLSESVRVPARTVVAFKWDERSDG